MDPGNIPRKEELISKLLLSSAQSMEFSIDLATLSGNSSKETWPRGSPMTLVLKNPVGLTIAASKRWRDRGQWHLQSPLPYSCLGLLEL